MPYKKIKSQDMSEAELRKLWADEYCDPAKPIVTRDGILVKFYPEMFDHAFFESEDWKAKDKSILSLNRCQKMHWIKEALQDEEALLKQGWNKDTRTYDDKRRVALVKDNYIVIIIVYKEKKARFISAYQVDDDENLQAILNGPDWA